MASITNDHLAAEDGHKVLWLVTHGYTYLHRFSLVCIVEIASQQCGRSFLVNRAFRPLPVVDDVFRAISSSVAVQDDVGVAIKELPLHSCWNLDSLEVFNTPLSDLPGSVNHLLLCLLAHLEQCFRSDVLRLGPSSSLLHILNLALFWRAPHVEEFLESGGLGALGDTLHADPVGVTLLLKVVGGILHRFLFLSLGSPLSNPHVDLRLYVDQEHVLRPEEGLLKLTRFCRNLDLLELHFP
mmetsp:Transcript_12313/g.17083  ORF Transcript_12313/g.17083 Transcript_12313/m.17083 type:complete len:240 (-) Transcript_12313:612-1331(-)